MISLTRSRRPARGKGKGRLEEDSERQADELRVSHGAEPVLSISIPDDSRRTGLAERAERPVDFGRPVHLAEFRYLARAWMVSQGLAFAFRKYSSLYVPQEDEARQAKRGLWSGASELPWEWRKAHR